MAEEILVVEEEEMMMTGDVEMIEEVGEDMKEVEIGEDLEVAGATALILEEDIENAAKIDTNVAGTEVVAELLPQNEENVLQAQALQTVPESEPAHTVLPQTETENNAPLQTENPQTAKESDHLLNLLNEPEKDHQLLPRSEQPENGADQIRMKDIKEEIVTAGHQMVEKN